MRHAPHDAGKALRNQQPRMGCHRDRRAGSQFIALARAAHARKRAGIGSAQATQGPAALHGQGERGLPGAAQHQYQEQALTCVARSTPELSILTACNCSHLIKIHTWHTYAAQWCNLSRDTSNIEPAEDS